jgi:hypothetical protein
MLHTANEDAEQDGLLYRSFTADLFGRRSPHRNFRNNLTANVNKVLITRHEHAARGQKSRSGAFCLIYKQIKARAFKELKFCWRKVFRSKKESTARPESFLSATQWRLARNKIFYESDAATFVDTFVRRW